MTSETVQAQKAVGISYTLKNSEGGVLDMAPLDDPLWFIQGAGGLLPAVEAALEGKSIGEKLSLDLSPEQGYGLRDETRVMSVPKDAFPTGLPIEVGMPFMIEAEGDVGASPWFIKAVDDDTVVMDGNHPLAGVALDFAIEVVAIWDAEPEELAHGHVHGPGGHHHH